MNKNPKFQNNLKKQIKSPFIIPGKFDINAKLENKEYSLNNLNFIMNANYKPNVIGQGGFGELLLAKHKTTNQLYAIKLCNKKKVLESGAKLEIIKREMAIHITLTHKNIVKLYSTSEDKNYFYLVMEYVPNGTLFSLIQKFHGLPEKESFKYFIQVAAAVQFLHSIGLAHRDIKPENILLDEDRNVKLCDFGWCVDVSKGERMTFCGTYEYMAPEIVDEKYYDYSIDVWSLGVLLYEMIHGFSPFRPNKKNTKDPMKEIFDNIRHKNYTIQKNISEECRDLIDKLLEIDKDKRIKVDEIFEHPWVTNKISEYFPNWNPNENYLNENNNEKKEEINNNNNENNDKKKKVIEKIFNDEDESDEDKKITEKEEKKLVINKKNILKNSDLNKENKLKINENDNNNNKIENSNKENIPIFDEEISTSNTYIKKIEHKNYNNDKDLDLSIDLEENKKNEENLIDSLLKNNNINKNKKLKKKISKSQKVDEIDLQENDEFNFLKDLNKYRVKKYDNSKKLNMNFLPKDLIYNKNTSYKNSTQNILRTIDIVEKAQKLQEEKNRSKINKSEEKKIPEKKGFFDGLLDHFKCGQCGNDN